MIAPCAAADGAPFLHASRAELGALLELGLSESLGRRVSIAAIEGRPLETKSTHPIDRLHLTLSSGEPVTAIFKRLGPVPGVKGHRREVLIYRRLLAGGRFGAPWLYGSVYDEAEGRYWLLLEDLGELTLKQAELADWQAAVRWLAAMHAAYLGREQELRELDCLGEHGRAYYLAIAELARGNLREAGASAALKRFDALMDRFDLIVNDLVAQPRTLVHGDLFAWNVGLQPGGRIRPFDWEAAAIGLPIWDLARLLDGWGEDKPEFFAIYLDELERHATVPVDRKAAGHAFELCEMVNVLWHFGWSVGPCRETSGVSALLDKLDHDRRRLLQRRP